jgi:hypothetical protein
MANEEHIALLKQGGGAWNAWREKNPNIVPDLNEADLIEAPTRPRPGELIGADLSNAALVGGETGVGRFGRSGP